MGPGKRPKSRVSKSVKKGSDDRENKQKSVKPQINICNQDRVAKKRKSETKIKENMLSKQRKFSSNENDDDKNSCGILKGKKMGHASNRQKPDKSNKGEKEKDNDEAKTSYAGSYDNAYDGDDDGDGDVEDDKEDDDEDDDKEDNDDNDDDDDDDDDDEEKEEEIEDDEEYSSYNQFTDDLVVEKLTGIKQYSDRELSSDSLAEYIASMCDGEDDDSF